MSQKTNYHHHTNLMFYGDNSKNLVLITYAEIGRLKGELYSAQYFYRLADGSLKAIADETRGDSEVEAIIKQTAMPHWLQRTIDELDYATFKREEIIDVALSSEETR